MITKDKKTNIKIKICIKDINGYGYFNDKDRTPFIMIGGGEIPITKKELKKMLKVYHN